MAVGGGGVLISKPNQFPVDVTTNSSGKKLQNSERDRPGLEGVFLRSRPVLHPTSEIIFLFSRPESRRGGEN